MKKALQLFVGIAISLVFLYFAFKGVDLDKIWANIQGAHYGWLTAVAGASLFSLWVRAQRWRYFYSHLKDIPLPSLFASQAVGFAANAVIPFRLGEAVKAFSISRKEKIPFTTSFTTVILERVFDMIAILVLLSIGISLVPIPETAGDQVTQAIRTLGIASGVVTAGIVFLMFKQELMLRWVDALLALLPDKIAEPIRNLVHAFVSGLHALTDPKQLAVIFAYSFYIWGILALPFVFGVPALGLNETFDPPMVLLGLITVTLVAIFVMIPAAPSFVGTYQAGCIVALSIFGIPKEEALSYSLLVHAFTFLPPTVLGLVYFAREGISLADVEHVEEPGIEAVEHEMEALDHRLHPDDPIDRDDDQPGAA